MRNEKENQSTQNREPKASREHKDKLFRFLFQDKADLLQLYNAVNNSNYDNPDDLEINTLEDAIYIHMKNDISFIIGSTLNLYEHQSSQNPNMPLRGLLYIADLYRIMSKEQDWDLFGAKPIKLKTPQYLVFYNGHKNEKDRTELKLSDAFENQEVEGCLECKATMLNINAGHNQEIMSKSRRLNDYAIFIATLNQCISEGLSLSQAAEKAIDLCIEQDILKDILRKEKSRVISSVLSEFDEKKYREGLLEYGREEEREKQEKKAKENSIRIARELLDKDMPDIPIETILRISGADRSELEEAGLIPPTTQSPTKTEP
jgi:hypothetical protein